MLLYLFLNTLKIADSLSTDNKQYTFLNFFDYALIDYTRLHVL